MAYVLCNTTEQETKKTIFVQRQQYRQKIMCITFLKLTTKPQHIFVADVEPVPRTAQMSSLTFSKISLLSRQLHVQS